MSEFTEEGEILEASARFNNSNINNSVPLQNVFLQSSYESNLQKNQLQDLDSSKKSLNVIKADASSGNKGVKRPRPTGSGKGVSLSFPVPNNKVGLIIGKSGVTVKGIQNKHNCTVQIPKMPDIENPTKRTLTVVAKNEIDAENGKAEVLAVCSGTQGNLPSVVPVGQFEAFCTIPNDKVGLVIGKGGLNIKQLKEETECQVQVPGIPDPESNPPTRTLSICGPPVKIPLCVGKIAHLIHRQPSNKANGKRNFAQQVAYSSPTHYQNHNQFNQSQYSARYVPEQHKFHQTVVGQSHNVNVQPVEQNHKKSTTDYKYTREEWKEWKAYYRAQGKDLQEEAPEHQRAMNYFG